MKQSLIDRVEVTQDDITKMSVDAIVNAANNSLLGGGGVDGAIHRAAGPELLKECRTLNGCETGQAKVTGAYRLPCKMVIHTVGPVWHGGGNGEPALLRSCYINALEAAIENNAKTIAFPSISTGVYRYPIKEASEIATQAVKEILIQYPQIEKVYFVCFDEKTFEAYSKLKQLFY